MLTRTARITRNTRTLATLSTFSTPSSTAATLSRPALTSFRSSFPRFFADNAQQPAAEQPAQPQQPAAETAAPVDPALAAKDKELASLKELNNKLTEQLKITNDKYLRAMAEIDNVMRRNKEEQEKLKKFGIQSFAKALLEPADVLETAVASADKQAAETDNQDFKNLHEGVSLTLKSLQKVFANNGIMKVEPQPGDKFDPHKHESVFQVDDPTKESNTVAMLIKSGYSIHDRIIRAPQVGTVKYRAPAEKSS